MNTLPRIALTTIATGGKTQGILVGVMADELDMLETRLHELFTTMGNIEQLAREAYFTGDAAAMTFALHDVGVAAQVALSIAGSTPPCPS